ncbi:MAG: hypothetical protein JNM56_15200 [Planctomycetia bacterium]|nr:hypothetical protein [Planctomycetia bacterium]
MIESTISISRMTLPQLQAVFLAIRPRILTHAALVFRGVPCSHQRAEYIAETVAVGWRWFLRLAERGKDARHFPIVLASYAARAVKSGRRLCGQLRSKEVLSELGQRRHGFRVQSLPSSIRRSFEELRRESGAQRRMDNFEERLQDNRQTPVPAQVAFRCDFSAWLKTCSRRDRHMIRAMGAEVRTLDLAKKFQLSPARISQLRREYANDWNRFCSDPTDVDPCQCVSA